MTIATFSYTPSLRSGIRQFSPSLPPVLADDIQGSGGRHLVRTEGPVKHLKARTGSRGNRWHGITDVAWRTLIIYNLEHTLKRLANSPGGRRVKRVYPTGFYYIFIANFQKSKGRNCDFKHYRKRPKKAALRKVLRADQPKLRKKKLVPILWLIVF